MNCQADLEESVKKKKSDTDRIQGVVTAAEKRKIERHAKQEGRTVSGLIRYALVKLKVL